MGRLGEWGGGEGVVWKKDGRAAEVVEEVAGGMKSLLQQLAEEPLSPL